MNNWDFMNRPFSTYGGEMDYQSPSGGEEGYTGPIRAAVLPMGERPASNMQGGTPEVMTQQHRLMMHKVAVDPAVSAASPLAQPQGQLPVNHHLSHQQHSSSFQNSPNVWLMPPLQTVNQRPPHLQATDIVNSPSGPGYTYPAPNGAYMPFQGQLPFPPINNAHFRSNETMISSPMASTQVQPPMANPQLPYTGLHAPAPVNYNIQMTTGQFQRPYVGSQQQYMGNQADVRSQLSSPFNETNIAKEARTSQMNNGNTFKPITPKKNSKPRIKKLTNQVDKKVMKKVLKVDDNDYKEAEPSMDPYFLHFLNSLKLSKDVSAPTSPCFYSVDTELEKKLFDLFIHEMSVSMDMFMMGNFFAEIVPEMALLDESGLILSSMYSLSALMLQRIDPDSIDLSIPINYYHQTIKSIRHHLSLPNSGEENNGTIARCLLSTILLGVYEMFFLATDNTYVKGAVSLLTSIISKTEDPSPLKSSPFLQMCFWAMFVCDLILSLKFNLATMFSVKNFCCK